MTAYISEKDSLEQALGKINAEVQGRRSYGLHREELKTTRRALILSWSNGAAEWLVTPPQTEIRCTDGEKVKRQVEIANETHSRCPREVKDMEPGWEASGKLHKMAEKGETKCRFVTSNVQCLDANEVAVVGVPRKVLNQIAPLLNQLPLYSGSFEARERGELSLAGIEIPPGLKQAWLESMVRQETLDVQSQIAIEEKIQEN